MYMVCHRINEKIGGNRRRAPVFLTAIFLIHLCALPALCGVKTKLDDDKWFEIGARIQGWYQSVDEENAHHLNDFMIRRAYLYMQGQVAPKLTFFTHIAGDRLGQEGVDTPGSGLGSGFSLRDGWIAYAPFEELKIQAGRMYIPFTRSFGTESMFALLTLDMPFAQGGVRAKGFYPSNVGRDDGVTVWGNLAKGLVQYRVGVFDGQQGTQNTSKSPRTAARISINPLESEGQFFNKGNYLGSKKVLSFGAGFDRQADLNWGANRPTSDYSAWTADVFFDHPVKSSAVNVEWAYAGIKNSQEYGDAKTWYLQGGWLMPSFTKKLRLQPYAKYESVYRNTAADTKYAGGGINLLFKQHDVKLTFEFDKVLPESGSAEHSKSIFTIQMQVGI
jgi:hypothetical protein